MRLKAFTNKMAKLKHTNPGNNTIQRHKLALKDFSRTCKNKKNDFWQKEYDNLEQLQYNNDFWDIWKTFGEEKILLLLKI